MSVLLRSMEKHAGGMVRSTLLFREMRSREKENSSVSEKRKRNREKGRQEVRDYRLYQFSRTDQKDKNKGKKS